MRTMGVANDADVCVAWAAWPDAGVTMRGHPPDRAQAQPRDASDDRRRQPGHADQPQAVAADHHGPERRRDPGGTRPAHRVGERIGAAAARRGDRRGSRRRRRRVSRALRAALSQQPPPAGGQLSDRPGDRRRDLQRRHRGGHSGGRSRPLLGAPRAQPGTDRCARRARLPGADHRGHHRVGQRGAALREDLQRQPPHRR